MALESRMGIEEDEEIDYIVWDLETTGFIAPPCKILEIGCFIVYESGTIEEKHWVLNNQCEIPEKIIEITGITKEIIEAEGRDPKECLMEFLPLFKESKMNITHNGISFDIPFLTNFAADLLGWTEVQKTATKLLIESKSFDTAVRFKADKLGMSREPEETFIQFAKRVMSIRAYGIKYNLGLCCEESGVNMTDIVQHRAMADVYLTNEIYKTVKSYEDFQ